MKYFIRTLLFFALVLAYSAKATAQNAPHPGGSIALEGRFEHPATVGIIVGLSLVLLIAIAWAGIRIYLMEAPRTDVKQ